MTDQRKGGRFLPTSITKPPLLAITKCFLILSHPGKYSINHKLSNGVGTVGPKSPMYDAPVAFIDEDLSDPVNGDETSERGSGSGSARTLAATFSQVKSNNCQQILSGSNFQRGSSSSERRQGGFERRASERGGFERQAFSQKYGSSSDQQGSSSEQRGSTSDQQTSKAPSRKASRDRDRASSYYKGVKASLHFSFISTYPAFLLSFSFSFLCSFITLLSHISLTRHLAIQISSHDMPTNIAIAHRFILQNTRKKCTNIRFIGILTNKCRQKNSSLFSIQGKYYGRV